MPQVFPLEFVLRACYFQHIEIHKGTQGQQKLQRQPVPMGQIGFQPYVNSQYLDHPKDHGGQRQGKKSVGAMVGGFREP
jgi:hypothetical protein